MKTRAPIRAAGSQAAAHRTSSSRWADRRTALRLPSLLTIAFLGACASAPVPASTPSQGTSAANPASAELPDAVTRAVDAVFAEFDDRSPGCAVGVLQGGELALARGYGMANLEHDVPIGAETVFRIASTSKQMTAGAIAHLAEEGILSLDDPLERWIPEFPSHAADVTLRHLLHHTSGLRDYLVLMNMAGYRGTDWYSDRDALEMILRQRELNFAPGSEFLYSNSGYFLLSVVVERATGQTLAEYAAERMFRPLGMASTHFHDDPTRVVPNRATGYSPTEGGYRIDETTLPMVGDGGVFTTIRDLALWVRNLEDPSTMGGAGWRDAMWTRGVLANGDTLDYALGLQYGSHRGTSTVGHGGSFVGFRADSRQFPDHGLAVYVLCNRSDAAPQRRTLEVAEVFLGPYLDEEPEPDEARVDGNAEGRSPEGEDPPRSSPSGPVDLGEYGGRYFSEELGTHYTIAVEEEELVARLPDGRELTLHHESGDVFGGSFPMVRASFERDSRGRVTGFHVDAGRTRGILFDRAGR